MFSIEARPQISWRCHVCLDLRPQQFVDAILSSKPPLLDMQAGARSKTIRHCNDRRICVAVANEMTSTKETQ